MSESEKQHRNALFWEQNKLGHRVLAAHHLVHPTAGTEISDRVIRLLDLEATAACAAPNESLVKRLQGLAVTTGIIAIQEQKRNSYCLHEFHRGEEGASEAVDVPVHQLHERGPNTMILVEDGLHRTDKPELIAA